MDVRTSGVGARAASLSGGNLQKFVVGREIERVPSLVVVNQPTWGVDAGSAARVRQSLVDLAEGGSAVLVISQDLDELLEIADRVAVINEGRLGLAHERSAVSREALGLEMAAGQQPHDAIDRAA